MAAMIIWSHAKFFPRDGECTMLIHFPGSLRARRFEKSTDVGPIVRNGSRSPQWCGARWRKQDTVQKGFVKSTASHCGQRNSLRTNRIAFPPCSCVPYTHEPAPLAADVPGYSVVGRAPVFTALTEPVLSRFRRPRLPLVPDVSARKISSTSRGKISSRWLLAT